LVQTAGFEPATT